jgi:hypothetical protein
MLLMSSPVLAMSPASSNAFLPAGTGAAAAVRSGSRKIGATFAGAPVSDTGWAPASLDAARTIEGPLEIVRRLPATGTLMPAMKPGMEGAGSENSVSRQVTPAALVLARRFAASDARTDSDRAVHAGMPLLADVQRQDAPAPAPNPVSNPAAPGARAAGGQANQGGSSSDVDELVDKVTRRLLRQLSIERERRGVNPCL